MMIDYALTENPNLIEELICEKIRLAPKMPMSKELSEMMISLCFAGDKFSIPEKEKPFTFKVIEKRLEFCFTYKINDARLILLICAVAENPARIIMYLWYLQSWCHKNGVREVDFEMFTIRIFPMGFPTEQVMSDIWDAAKVSDGKQSYNLADIARAGESIQFGKTKEQIRDI